MIAPFAGALEGVVVRSDSSGAATRTDADGRFELSGISPPVDRLYFEKGNRLAVLEVRTSFNSTNDLGVLHLTNVARRVASTAETRPVPALGSRSSAATTAHVAADLTVESVAAAAGMSSTNLTALARQAGIDPAAWQKFLGDGAIPADATNAFSRKDILRLAAALKDRISAEDAEALAMAVTGLKPEELKNWFKTHAGEIPRNADGSYTELSLAAALALIRSDLKDKLNLPADLTSSGSVARALSAAAGPYPLYDASRGTLPGDQSWWYLTYPPNVRATNIWKDGAAQLDTTAVREEKAGYFTEDPISGEAYRHPGMPILDRHSGFTVQFEMRMFAENHVRNDRAGFNVIVICNDLSAIELSFWRDQVWVQADDGKPIFQNSHGETAPFDATSGRARFELAVKDDTYTLRADGRDVLTGRLRNYTAFGGYPYDVPNFLFIGDDTTSAGAKCELGNVAVALAQNATASRAGLSSAIQAMLALGTNAATAAVAGGGASTMKYSGDSERIVDVSDTNPGRSKENSTGEEAACVAAKASDAESAPAELAAIQGMKMDVGIKFGNLRVISDPPWASVSLRQTVPEISPATFPNLLPGRYEVSVTMTGFKTQTLTVSVDAGKTTLTNVVLVEQEGSGVVRTRATVFEGDKQVGAFATISDALAAATPGARIVVGPGLYREGLVLDKPVRIEGAGNPRDIVVESVDGPCLVIRSGDATVSGLSMRAKLGRKALENFAVDIARGSPVLDHCDILSESLAAVAIHGEGTAPELRWCTVQRGRTAGVLVFDHAKGTLTSCQIVRSGQSGIELRDGADPTLRTCNIHDGSQAGILVHGGARGVFEECDVAFNLFAGAEVREDGDPVFKHCKFHEGNGGGVFVHDQGRGIFEDCQFVGNVLADVEVRSGGNPVFRDCAMTEARQAGVFVHDGGRGAFDHCVVAAGHYAGVEIAKGGAPAFTNCTIERGMAGGVLAYDGGEGLFEMCDIRLSALPGIEISSGANPVFRDCTIQNGLEAGLLATAGGKGRLEHCEISAHLAHGVEIRAGADPVLTGCTITRNRLNGVRVRQDAAGTVEKSNLHGNEKDSLLADKPSTTQLRENQL